MGLSGFIGQKPIVDAFNEMNLRGLLGHAYALSGPAGIGKKTLANQLAKLLLCQQPPHEAPCGRCNACKTMEAGFNPNFTRVTSKTQKILIEQIRVLIEDISVKPPIGRKVYLIEDADRMTPQAQNCLLKTLEEPPGYAVILMTVTNFESLLLTVRSRVVQLKLQRYTNEELSRILENKTLRRNDYSSVIAFSEGVAGKALNLAQNEGFQMLREMVLRFVFCKDKQNIADCELNLFLSKNKEAFHDCLSIMETVYRDIIFVISGKTDGLINADKRDNIVEYAYQHSMQELIDKVSQLDEIRSNLKSYMNYQLAVDLVTLT